MCVYLFSHSVESDIVCCYRHIEFIFPVCVCDLFKLTNIPLNCVPQPQEHQQPISTPCAAKSF